MYAGKPPCTCQVWRHIHVRCDAIYMPGVTQYACHVWRHVHVRCDAIYIVRCDAMYMPSVTPCACQIWRDVYARCDAMYMPCVTPCICHVWLQGAPHETTRTLSTDFRFHKSFSATLQTHSFSLAYLLGTREKTQLLMFGSGFRPEKILQIQFFNQCRRSFFLVVVVVIVVVVVTSVCADDFPAVAGDCGRRN